MPRWDEAAVDALAGRLRLSADPRRRQRPGGARVGACPGASLELHDHRAYQPGDDLRHLDWGVFARTDPLVSPRLAVVYDASASMGLTPAKAALSAGLAALLVTLAEAEGAPVDLWLMGAAPRPVPPRRAAWRRALRDADLRGAAGLEATPPPRLSPGGERILVSDGLCPGGGALVAKRLGRQAGTLTLIQTLTRHEADPAPLGPVRLQDVEGGSLDLVLDEAACAAYRARLERHVAGWRDALHGRGRGVIPVTVEQGLDAAAQALMNAGLVEARAR